MPKAVILDTCCIVRKYLTEQLIKKTWPVRHELFLRTNLTASIQFSFIEVLVQEHSGKLQNWQRIMTQNYMKTQTTHQNNQ